MRTSFRVALQGGTTRWVVANGILVVDPRDRDAKRLVGWFELRSRRRRIERILSTSAHRMALAAAAADLGFWRIDLATQRRWLSPFALALFGLDAHETLSTEMFYEAVHPEDRERVRANRARVVAERGRLDDVFRIVDRHGRMRVVHSVAAVLPDELTGRDQLIGVTADVTNRVHTEEELLERQHQLAHLARVAMVGELSGAIAHEVSQPITAIINTARAAERVLERTGEIDRATVLAILDEIADAGKRAGAVVQRIRGLIRNQPLALEPVHLGGLVVEVLEVMRSELLAHQVKVQVDVDAALPHVRGDRVELQQVLVNLILNACEAMTVTDPADRLLDIAGIAQADGGCALSVADRGPGIAAESTERIFEPFMTTKANGVGLGLPICRMVVARHGGRLWAESGGSGATFRLVLPGVVE